MKVKELIEILKPLDQEKVIKIAETCTYYNVSEKEITEETYKGESFYVIDLETKIEFSETNDDWGEIKAVTGDTTAMVMPDGSLKEIDWDDPEPLWDLLRGVDEI